MAHEILRGHLFTFYWGQHYGGGEPYLVAALFALFGQSRLVLGTAPILLDGVSALLVWRIGRQLFGPRVGVLAALLFWLWPEVYVYLSTVEYGFRLLDLVCGLAVLLFALRLDSRGSKVADWAALGLSTGLGWWCSPEIAYFVIPAAAWLVYSAVRDRAPLRPLGVVVMAVAAVLGAAPWLAVNIGHGYPSLQTPVGLLRQTGWLERLDTFFVHVAPLVFGLRLRGSGGWLIFPAAGIALYVLLGLLLLVWVATLAFRGEALLLAFFVALFPLLYAYSSYAVYWNDGRYAIYLAPVLALLAASGLDELARSRARVRRAVPALGLVAAVAVTLAAAARLEPYTPLAHSHGARASWTSWRADPDQWLGPLVSALERSHIRGAYAGYWVAYALTFESHGRVVASDPGDDRYPPYLAAIERSSHPVWVFPRPSTLEQLNAAAGVHQWSPSIGLTGLLSYLRQTEVSYRSTNVGYFTVVRPFGVVSPWSIFAAVQAGPLPKPKATAGHRLPVAKATPAVRSLG